MKTIGLIGGMSWESSLLYYRWVNELVKKELGGFHSAKVVMHSVDFHEIEEKQRLGDWKSLDTLMADAARSLERAGADFIVLCTNTMHKCVAAIESAVAIPLLHIADPTAVAIQEKKIKTVALLGTRFTMEQDFYKERLIAKFGLSVIVPPADEIEKIHQVIYQELVKGIVTVESRTIYQQIIQKLVDRGAEGVILGCTEITLLIQQQDVAVPVFDTTELHARRAVEIAIGASFLKTVKSDIVAV